MSDLPTLILSPAQILAQSTSSGFGGSYWGYFQDCAAKLRFKREYPTVHEVNLVNFTGAKRLNMSTVGVFFHKLRELWRLGHLDGRSSVGDAPNLYIEWGGQFEIPEWKEACRLFQFYIGLASRTEWDTVSAEEGFEFGCRHCAKVETSALCQDPKVSGVGYDDCKIKYDICQKALDCIEEWGVPCISGRYDEIAFVTPEQLDAMRTGFRSLPLLMPGHYVVDAKSKTTRYETVNKQHEISKQFTLYELAWNRSHPESPCQGVIVDGVYAYKKEPLLESFFVMADDHKAKVLKQHLSKCWNNYLNYGLSVNTDRCFDYGKECLYLERNICNRLDD
jgi:hypothetical protein